LKHILRMSDSFTPVYLVTGDVHEKMENFAAAMKIWEKGFRATSSPALLQRMGGYFLSRDLPEQAIECYRRAIFVHPDDPILEFCLGALYRKLEMNQEAIKIFEVLDKRNPGWMLNRVMLASLQARSGQFEKAARTYHEIFDSGEIASILFWQCYNCNTTYVEYESFCVECLSWNTVNLNHTMAG